MNKKNKNEKDQEEEEEEAFDVLFFSSCYVDFICKLTPNQLNFIK